MSEELLQIVKIKEPAIEPVKLESLKLLTHIDEDIENDILNGWIQTARIHAEDFQKRAFITQTLELSLDGFPSMPFNIPYPRLQSLVSIKYYDFEDTENILDIDNIIHVDTASDPGRIGFKYNQYFPSTILREMASVKIQFVAGYGDKTSDVPADVKDAIAIYASHRNENRASEDDDIPDHFYNLLRPNRVK